MNSTIKPKEGQCIDCPSGTPHKVLMAKRCFTGPYFHYQKHQKAKYAEKQAGKVSKPALGKAEGSPVKKRIPLKDKNVPELLKGDHFVCIACNTPKPLSQMDAGHFYSAGNHSYLRFNENNVHGECRKCNYFMSGHLLAYRENLIKKIGIKEVEKLDQFKNIKMKWDRVQLMALIEKYRNLLKSAA
jgi:hypothetical protein